MTIRYVGPGGSDSNNGLSWANRKLTLNGVEDTPVVAGDTVYVGPGVYRATLMIDVSGSGGSPITYIGDVTGQNTDGVGGIVRITGSDNDQTATRNYWLDASAAQRDYRTFRGISFDMAGTNGVYTGATALAGTNWIFEECTFDGYATSEIISVGGANQLAWMFQRCIFFGNLYYTIEFSHTSTISNAGHVINNCLFLGISGIAGAIGTARVGGITVSNCTFIGEYRCGRVLTALAASSYLYFYNCVFHKCYEGLRATVAGELVEDYNTFSSVSLLRTNVNTGANSVTYPALFNPPVLREDFRFPWLPFDLSKWSQVARKAGTSMIADDLFGITRPATDSKKSWGAIQYTGAIRETTTTYNSSAASLKLPDAGEQFLMRVPITNVSTTIALRCYREADYVGTNPQMILRQPGQSDRTITDTGNASTWNQLTDTFTPAALPPYVDIFIKSNNTAISGNYDTFFDTVVVS